MAHFFLKKKILFSSIEGGRPAPHLIFQMGSTNSTPKILNNTQTQVRLVQQWSNLSLPFPEQSKCLLTQACDLVIITQTLRKGAFYFASKNSLPGHWSWDNWQHCGFRHQRFAVRIRSFTIFIHFILQVVKKTNSEKRLEMARLKIGLPTKQFSLWSHCRMVAHEYFTCRVDIGIAIFFHRQLKVLNLTVNVDVTTQVSMVF